LGYSIAVDLDGTLAEYEDWHGSSVIGKPIPLMLDRVKKWLAEGKEVTIFTARANNGPKAIKHIKAWLRLVGLPDLPITNIKEHDFDEFWDDRAVTVERNTGIKLTHGK
jgi:hypothetical protein